MKFFILFIHTIKKFLNMSIEENSDCTCSLLLAAMKGDLKLVEHFINSGTNVNISDKYGMTPLYHAAENGHLEVVILLLEKGADNKFACDAYKWTPLHKAIQNGHTQTAIYIMKYMKYNFDMKVRDHNRDTPLHTALFMENIDIIKFMLNNFDCDVTSHNHHAHTPLDIACMKDLPLPIVKLLLEKGANPNSLLDETNPGWTSLFHACKSCNQSLLTLLIKHGGILDYKDSYDNTLYHIACLYGNLDIVKLLFEHIPENINLESHLGIIPLHFACLKGKKRIVEYLAEQQEQSPKLTDINGDNSLCFACEGGHLPIVKWILCSGKIDRLPDHRKNYPDYDSGCLTTVENFLDNKVSFGCLRISFLRACSKRCAQGGYTISNKFEDRLVSICSTNWYIKSSIYLYLGLHNFI